MKEIRKKYWPNGQTKIEVYCINDKWHREDGPAYIEYYENGQIEFKSYILNDRLHREDGPARIWYNENGQIQYEDYWINGKEITDEFKIMVMKGLEIK